MEGGELLDEIQARGDQSIAFTELETAKILVQVLSAVQFMHNKHLIHFDLKPENILFERQDCDRIKLIDFKLCNTPLRNKKLEFLGCALPSALRKHQVPTVLGSIYYIAPEVLN